MAPLPEAHEKTSRRNHLARTFQCFLQLLLQQREIPIDPAFPADQHDPPSNALCRQ